MRFDIITIFPRIFDSYIHESILKRAQEKKLINIKIHDLRKWTTDKHKTVDDSPYGGGAGMVMKVEPIYRALQALKKQETRNKKQILNSKIILLSAKGKTWDQGMAKKYSKLDNIIMICGRYEGVDERVKKFIDEEISIGDFVMTGGEIGTLALVDSITRLIPGSLGNAESAKDESHSKKGILEYPQYTRPETFEISNPSTLQKKSGQAGSGLKKLKVPKVLLSGNHAEIDKWRKKHKKIKNSA